jgi:sigma-B regulation protein RsbU (phosphoserine phosphatase)
MTTDPIAHLRHELRTPLNHIIGYSELLLDEVEESGHAALEPGLQHVLESARQLLTQINDFLSPSRIDGGNVDLALLGARLDASLDTMAQTCAQLRALMLEAGADDLLPDLERITSAAERLRTLTHEGVGEAHAETPAAAALTLPQVEAPAVAAAHGSILVVDDNEINRDMLTRRLARLGYEMQSAPGGREALELLQEQRVDLILLDVMMPDMDGYEVLRRLKSDRAQREIPVLMISALDELDSVVRCIELGAEDYLFKPFDPVLLRARIGACLEKKRLRDEIMRHVQRIERELEFARAIQLSMVPTDFPQPTAELPLEVYATLQPAREIGGDLYDCFWITARHLCVVVADVSSAALYMALTKTAVRLLAAPQSESRAPSAAELVAKVNDELCRQNPYAMFVTLFLCIVDAGTGSLSWCNAGHNPPYLLTPDGTLTKLAGGRNLPAGVLDEFSTVSDEGQLAAGGSLFLYTDGITEAANAAQEFFGEERLESALRSYARSGPEDLVVSVLKEVRAFAGAAAPSDDIAMLACRWNAHDRG